MRLYRIALSIALAAGEIVDAVRETCDTPLPGLGKLLGHGKQGEVYDLGDRVMKIQVVADEAEAKERVQELQKLMQKDSSVYPKVYEVDVLCEIENPGVGVKHGWAYYYVMEKLSPADHAEDVAKILRSKINGKPMRPFMNSPHLDAALELYERMEDSGTVHVDVNPGNIMETPDGELKLIDLDSVVVS